MRKEISFRPGLSDSVKNLIENLLEHEAKYRLPLIKVFIHPWVIQMSEKHSLGPKSSEINK